MADSYAFMKERITEDAGEAFRPTRYSLKSKADVVVQPYKTYDLFFEIEFHVIQKLGAYEDIGTPEECAAWKAAAQAKAEEGQSDAEHRED